MDTLSSHDRPLRIALVGTRGVPARYGGFETCVEEVGQRLAARGHEVVVYCRKTASTDTTRGCGSSTFRRCGGAPWKP